ncbi:MAG: hypothetical protein ACRDH9_08420 [Actinomycetota bacterium]
MKLLSAGLMAGLFLIACSSEAKAPAPVSEEAAPPPSSTDSTSTSALCVEVYSPETLAGRSFAFDGTVMAIETRTDPKLPAEEAEVPWVTFDVNRWYIGGSSDEIGVWVEPLNVETSNGTITAEVGTRLLVSGEPRWGGDPLEDPLAWICGFTQPWSEEAAAEWEAATA